MTFCFVVLLTLKSFCTTWSKANPYTQKIEGQKVLIKAYPYEPYKGSPMLGLTKVYYDNKLLYTIDKYFREKIFSSPDGHYLAVVNFSNAIGVSSYTSSGNEKINFNQTAIQIFKDGIEYKKINLKEVCDTSNIPNNGRYYNWGYYLDIEAFKDAENGCKSCLEIYGKKVLAKCDTSEIYEEECEECNRQCDSVKLKQSKIKLYENSVYVENNSLFALTSGNYFIKLDFANMILEQKPFDEVVLNYKTFNPPKLKRNYIDITLPEKFDEPNFKDGRSFEKGISDFLGLSVCKFRESGTYTLFINQLVIDKYGKCISISGNVYDKRISESLSEVSKNQEMTNRITEWLYKQQFDTKLIPKKFNAFSFMCIVSLK